MDESAAMPEPLTNPLRLISVFIRFTVPFHTRQRRKPELDTLEAPVTPFYGSFLADLSSRVLAAKRMGMEYKNVVVLMFAALTASSADTFTKVSALH